MKTIAGLLTLLLLGACGTSLRQEDSNVVHFNTLYRTQYSQIGIQQSVVVRDESAWQRLWDQQTKTGAPLSRPDIDFSENMILAVMLGARPNGCYSVSIDTLRAMADKLVAEFSETVPGGGDFCTYGITSPAHFVVVPQDPRPVEFLKIGK